MFGLDPPGYLQQPLAFVELGVVHHGLEELL